MAAFDLGKLLSPVAEGAPSGPNLEYDPAFAALERAALGRLEQVIGGVVTPAEPPDWKAVAGGAVVLLERTKDLRVATHLARALLHLDGVAGLGEGLMLLHGLLKAHWATLHPQLDPEDDNDPTMRITALSALTTPAFASVLRHAPLVSSRLLGAVSLADIAAGPGTADAARIAGVFAEVELGVLEACGAAVESSLNDLHGIEGVFEAQAGGRGPELSPLLDYFHKAGAALAPHLAERRAAAQGAEAASGGSPDAAATAPQARGLSGDILTREDVVKALEKICLYYRRFEPSSPVPLVAERCKRLVTMSFIDILSDVAPDGLKQAQLVLGKQGDAK
jgi:type VI secretion system protein ImpA